MAIAKDIQALGVEWTGLTEDMAENIQPRFQANIHKEDFTGNNSLRVPSRLFVPLETKGVSVNLVVLKLLEQFASLMKKTEAHKSIHLRGIDYYESC